jgi:hypothetical protein
MTELESAVARLEETKLRLAAERLNIKEKMEKRKEAIVLAKKIMKEHDITPSDLTDPAFTQH